MLTTRGDAALPTDDELCPGRGVAELDRHREQHRRRHGSRTGLLALAIAFAGTFAAMAIWSFASPLMSVPDEPTEVMKAAAVVRGQFVGHLIGPSTSALGVVRIPAFYADLPSVPVCYHRKSAVPASCAPAPSGGSTLRTTTIYDARYPPLYYAIVGLPSLLGVGDAELYLMRLVSALLSAVLIGLAAFAAVRWSRPRLVLAGVVVATTPMVLFLGGAVNPVGLEAAAGIALWASGSVLVLEQLENPPPGLLALVAGSAATLALCRPISPFWVALIALGLVAVADWRQVRRALSLRRVRIALGVVALAGAVASAWILGESAFNQFSHSSVPASTPFTTILATSFAHNDYYLPGMIGVFGWFDTWSPQFTYIAWYGLVALFSFGAAAVAEMRQAVTLLAFAVAIVVVPVAISSSQAHRLGYNWSGKDELAFAVGLPILAAALLARSSLARHRGRLTGIVCLAAFLAQSAAFFEMLRRYAVGAAGAKVGFLTAPKWQPPISLLGALAAEVVVLLGLGVAAWLAVRSARPGSEPLSSAPVAAAPVLETSAAGAHSHSMVPGGFEVTS